MPKRLRRLLMLRSERAFYRSRFVTVMFLLTGGFVAYALSPLAPYAFHSAPSLVMLHRLLGSWWVLSVPFAVYALLLAWGTIRAAIVADTLGLVLYLIELAALVVTSARLHEWNPLILCAFGLVAVMHYAALRLAVIDLARTEQGLR